MNPVLACWLIYGVVVVVGLLTLGYAKLKDPGDVAIAGTLIVLWPAILALAFIVSPFFMLYFAGVTVRRLIHGEDRD